MFTLTAVAALAAGRADPPAALTREAASAFARIALKAVVREYPNKPEHVLAGPDDARTPKVLHPAFYGSYDWHSAVHMHWLLARIQRLYPKKKIAERLARQLTPIKRFAEGPQHRLQHQA